jgi:hypothetical protein
VAHDPASGPDPDPPRDIAVVRPGHREIYEFLRHFEAANYTELVGDRRVADRRGATGTATPDRRTGQRRGLPSPTWDGLGFVLAPRRAGEASTGPDARPDGALRGNLFVVRHGHPDVFDLLADHFHDDDSVQVIWDRRASDRRRRSQTVPVDRRRRGRRRLAP